MSHAPDLGAVDKSSYFRTEILEGDLRTNVDISLK